MEEQDKTRENLCVVRADAVLPRVRVGSDLESNHSRREFITDLINLENAVCAARRSSREAGVSEFELKLLERIQRDAGQLLDAVKGKER